MKKVITGLLIITVLAASAYFGVQQYRLAEVLNTLRPTVQLASNYLDEFYALEGNPEGISLAEYCEKANAALNDLDKELVGLKRRSGTEHDELYSIVALHIETSQQSIREFSAYARHRLDHESAKESADDSVAKLQTSRNHRELKITRTHAEIAIKDLKEARLKSEKSMALVYASAALVKSQRHVLENRFGTKSVVSRDRLDYILNKFNGEPGKNSV
ncbi:hypothetical protein [Noviherbaspirillum sp.]|uniref:hypothetical protein n=1 Tax=Noviherbaspirillum sp. TaxID=1926288 RepID=UPI002FE2FBF9